MGDFITLVILAIGWYTSTLVHELAHFSVWPRGNVHLTLNPLNSSAWVLGIPRNRLPYFYAAGIMVDFVIMAVLPQYFAVGGILGLFLTAVAFTAFIRVMWRFINSGIFLPVGYFSDPKRVFGKNFRIASVIGIAIVLVVFQYYVVNFGAFLQTFLP